MKKKNASTVEHYYSHCGRPEDKKKIFFSLFRYRRRPPPSTHRKESHLSSLFFFFFFLLVGRSVGRSVSRYKNKKGLKNLVSPQSSRVRLLLIFSLLSGPISYVHSSISPPTQITRRRRRRRLTFHMQMTVATTTYGSGGRGGSSTLSTAVSYYIHPS